MRFLSLFSGIEAASVAWVPLGWECAGVAEIEAFPCALLRHYYPKVRNLGDVKKISAERIAALGRLGLVVFGFPCQDLSVAGKRAGLKGERSGLFFDAMRVVRMSGSRFALAENVPGLFSSNEGRDFAAVVGEMAGVQPDIPDGGWRNSGFFAGPDALVEWAVLDAQYFGVPQRRRRVFIVRDSGDWLSRPPVLSQPASLSGYPSPSRETGQDVAGCLRGRSYGADVDTCESLIPILDGAKGRTCERGSRDGHGIGEPGDAMFTLRAESAHAIGVMTLAMRGRDDGQNLEVRDDGTANAILTPNGDRGGIGVGAVAIGLDSELNAVEDGAGPLKALSRSGGGVPGMVSTAIEVRRLTPVECERLQGFPDDYTKLNARTADGVRYKALGNSMAVPVMRWIGERIQAICVEGQTTG